jgi:hypothetical protein
MIELLMREVGFLSFLPAFQVVGIGEANKWRSINFMQFPH